MEECLKHCGNPIGYNPTFLFFLSKTCRRPENDSTKPAQKHKYKYVQNLINNQQVTKPRKKIKAGKLGERLQLEDSVVALCKCVGDEYTSQTEEDTRRCD